MPQGKGDRKVNILIDLTESTDIRPFTRRDEVIQVDALKQVERLLARNLNEAKKADRFKDRLPRLYLDRRHNTITLHGRRGSGKTTFLVHVLELLRENEMQGVEASEIEILGIIDPTLIENKENVFINVLALIKEKIDAEYANRRRGVGDNYNIEERYHRWREGLLKLAAGLTLLDGVGGETTLGENWKDPKFVLEKGLKDAKSGTKLERNFHDFIQESLTFLGKRAFLLALDDIDTDFRRGWPILEVLRKYLTSRQLIVMLSGNLELYSLLVRSKQWNNMPAALKIKDRKNWHLYEEMVDELQGQYLQKVLKTENRVEVVPLSYYTAARSDDHAIRVMLQGEGGRRLEVLLEAFLTFSLLNGFYLNLESDRRQLAECLLRQPLRSVLQVFHAMHEWLVPLWDGDPRNRPLPISDDAVVDAMTEFQDTLPMTFLEALMEKGVPFERLNTATADELLPILAEFLTFNDAWQEGYRLKAEFTDDAFNLSAVTLGARLAREMNRTPELLLDYFVKIGGSREAMLLLPAKNPAVRPAMYSRFVGLDSNDAALQVARRSLAVWRENAKGNLIRDVGYMGTVALQGKRPSGDYARRLHDPWTGDLSRHVRPYFDQVGWSLPDTDDKGIPRLVRGHHFNTLSSLQESIYSWHRDFVSLPAAIVLTGKGDHATYVSVHHVIGLIADMLRSDDPFEVLVRASQLRSYPSPNWGQDGELRDEVPLDDDEPAQLSPQEVREREDVLGFDVAIDNWSQWVCSGAWRLRPRGGDQLIPVHVAAKMWTRFYYTLRRIDDELPASDRFAGFMMHRYIVAFFNAVLVEEHLNRAQVEGPMRVQNSIRSDQNFMVNFRQYRKTPSQYPFFNMLFRCPLWSLYLNPDAADQGDNLFKLQLKSWGSGEVFRPSSRGRIPDQEDIESLIRVQFQGADGRRATFPNLYYLMNTIPVHSESGGTRRDISRRG